MASSIVVFACPHCSGSISVQVSIQITLPTANSPTAPVSSFLRSDPAPRGTIDAASSRAAMDAASASSSAADEPKLPVTKRIAYIGYNNVGGIAPWQCNRCGFQNQDEFTVWQHIKTKPECHEYDETVKRTVDQYNALPAAKKGRIF